MLEYVTVKEIYIALLFPLICTMTPLFFTYFLFEPINGLIKKT